MRRLRNAVVLLAAGAALASAAGSRAADQELHWRALEVEARLDGQGALHVRERQAMVFTGAWNGGERRFDLRPGQRLRFERLSRIDADGGPRPLVQGSLAAVDHWDFTDGETLRWRSRLPSDPEFQETELVYLLEYTLEHVLVERGGGRFVLNHDFAFPDRSGPILSVRARLELDPAWKADRTSPITASGGPLEPGRSAVLEVPLTWVGAGDPPSRALRRPFAILILAGLAAALAAVAALVLGRGRALGLLAPLTPADQIDAAWLQANLFLLPPDAAGLAWHGRVGPPEVSALIARMERERKLVSRAVPGKRGTAPVVQLERLVPLNALRGRERDLAEALFLDGEETDTLRIRQHYRNRGFDPAALVEHDVRMDLQAAAPEPRERSRRAGWIAVVALAVVAFGLGVGAQDRGEPGGWLFGSLVGLVLLFPVAAVAAWRFRARPTGQAGAVAVAGALPVAGAAAVAGLVLGGAAGAFTALALSLGCASAAGALALIALPRTSPERVALRKRVASARAFFAAELGRAAPRLDDAWTPYLLALGLDREADRWARIHGTAVPVAPGTAPGREPLTSGPSGAAGEAVPARWTGGGGMFSGGGASASWAAIGAISAPIAAPSSSSGSSSSSSGGFSSDSGSSSSSGGGGGGGW